MRVCYYFIDIVFIMEKKISMAVAAIPAVCLLLLAGCSGKKTVEVTPENSLDWMSVYRITIEDTATVIQGNVYGREGDCITIPSDVYLRGGAAGTEYRLLHSPQDAQEKTVTIPQDMTMPFTLVFEPLAGNEPYVDLCCGNETIKGIRTRPVKTKYRTAINGTLTGRPNTSRMILIQAGLDERVNPYISIPVSGEKFSYTLRTDTETAYELICWDELMNGSWRPATVFSDNGTVDIRFFPWEDDKAPEITGTTSEMNREYQEYRNDAITRFREKELQAMADSLFAADNFYTEKYTRLLDSAIAAGYPADLMEELNRRQRDEDMVTEAAMEYIKEYDSLDRATDLHIIRYNEENPGIVGYYILFDRYMWENDSTSKAGYREIFHTLYEKQYPDHPFTVRMLDLIASEDIRPGGRYIDFTAPEPDGTEHTLSEEIKGKIAVIDLWASWCGPCRRHSRELIPVYNEYKDRGFTVVGVARETGNTDAMENAIKKDGYPWLNLVEMNDRDRIWQKYGAGNGGGRIILVAADGSIVKVDPTAEYVKKYLEDNIK